MTETAPEAVTETKRVFFAPDYRRAADMLRRARKNKTPGQLAAVDQLTAAMAAAFITDSLGFDIPRFTNASKLRIETVLHEDYVTWATEKGYGTEPSDAPQYHDEYHGCKMSAVSPGYGEDPDEDDYEDDTPTGPDKADDGLPD